MDTKELLEFMDQQRWLLNNGLVSENTKNQLFFYGSIAHKDIQALEVEVDVEKKMVAYRLFFDKKLMKKIDLYAELSKSTTLLGMWRFRRLLRKEGTLDFNAILSRFVKDFCGPTWHTSVEVLDFTKYVETSGVSNEVDNRSEQSDKLPNE